MPASNAEPLDDIAIRLVTVDRTEYTLLHLSIGCLASLRIATRPTQHLSTIVTSQVYHIYQKKPRNFTYL